MNRRKRRRTKRRKWKRKWRKKKKETTIIFLTTARKGGWPILSLQSDLPPTVFGQ